MTEQEIQEEAGILDKACRQVGSELAAGGVNAMHASFAALKAMVGKFQRLEAVKQMKDAEPQSDQANQ
jgi:hypothetical protein